MTLHLRRLSGQITALILGLAAPAMSQTIIDQAKAVNGLGGCDAPGFPVTICNSGPYKLASNLTLRPSEANKNAIHVIVANFRTVTLDLNGFTITGMGDDRTDLTTGHGVYAPANPLIVRNGTIQNMALAGLMINNTGASRVENVSVRSNGWYGILMGAGLIRDCFAWGNVYTGIGTLSAASIIGNSSVGNGGDGFLIAPSSIVTGNLAIQNTGYGLSMHDASVAYKDNVLNLNNSGNKRGGTSLGPNLCGTARCP